MAIQEFELDEIEEFPDEPNDLSAFGAYPSAQLPGTAPDIIDARPLARENQMAQIGAERARLLGEAEDIRDVSRIANVASGLEKSQQLIPKLGASALDLIGVDAGREALEGFAQRNQQLRREDEALGVRDTTGKIIEGVTQAAAELPVQMIGGAGSKGAQAIRRIAGTQGGMAGLGRYGEERGQGTGRGEAAALGAASGLITGVVTKAFGATGAEAIFRNEGVKGVANRILSAAKDAGMEGLEEMTDTFYNDLLERITRNPNKPIQETVEELLLSGTIGAAIGAPAGVAAGVQGAEARPMEFTLESGKDAPPSPVAAAEEASLSAGEPRKMASSMTMEEALDFAKKTGELRLERNRAANKAYQDRSDPAYREAESKFNRHRDEVIRIFGLRNQNYNKGLGLDAQQLAERLTPEQAISIWKRAQNEASSKTGKTAPPLEKDPRAEPLDVGEVRGSERIRDRRPEQSELPPVSPAEESTFGRKAPEQSQQGAEVSAGPIEGRKEVATSESSARAIGEAMGAEFKGVAGPRRNVWQFELKTADGKPGPSIGVPVGSTPEQVRAKYQEAIERFGDDPNAPRPLPPESEGSLSVADTSKPEIAQVAPDNEMIGGRKNPFGDPSGTTYYATPEDWEAWQKVAAKATMENWGERERIRNKYGGMNPEPPKASLSASEGFTYEMAEPPSRADIDTFVKRMKAENPGAAPVFVAENYHELPDNVHRSAYKQGANPVGIKGVLIDGVVYINRQMMESMDEVHQTWLHEQAGHFATDNQLGKKLNRFMEQVYSSFTKTPLMAQTRILYPKGNTERWGREYIARLSENPQADPGAWSKIVAMFRRWLRDIGWVKTVDENDIRVLLQRSMAALKAKRDGATSEEGSLAVGTPAPGTPPTGGTPPAPPTPTPPGAPAPVPTPPGTLDDIYAIFEPTKRPSPTLRQRGTQIVEAFRTGVSSKFRPVNKLAEDIAKAYGMTSSKDIAGIMEQLKGSQGKAEADIYRFDRDVSDLVKGDEKDFNAYMFLQRTVDRLNQDAADVAAGLPARRKVSHYTLADMGQKIRLLESKLGPDKLRTFEDAADRYQQHMDQALQLQVESGRMSPAVYADIKASNQFYAPFKVMKYIEEQMRPAGSGKRIDTLADFTKAMEGIEDPDVKLGDILAAGRQGISMSRILADKNTAMRNVAELAAFDTRGDFIKKLRPDQDAPRGMEVVNVLEAGKETRYAVNPDVAEAIQLYGGNAGGVISRILSGFSIPFRAGATAFNIPFQVGNLMIADAPRAALLSKYGVRNPLDLVRYPLDFTEALFKSMVKNMTGYQTKLMSDFLDSGVAGTTVQEHLTPEALKFKEPTSISKSRKMAESVLFSIPRFAKAIEETNKVLGVKRAMRIHGATSGKELAKLVPEAITELRRFSGSPDFGRQGKWVEQARLNLLFMFLNARIQGTVADLGRLGGRDGASTAAKSWFKIATAVGIPTAYLYFLNQLKEYKDDYDKRPVQEKQNYWLIPKDTFITNEDGERIRDYWRVPKRESSKWIANFTEAALDFASKRDPKSAKDFASTMLHEISPVNITGENVRERMESVASSLNPALKMPLELATGRDLYRHRDIIPDSMQKASPEQQYTQRTAEAFKVIAEKMPDVMPETLRSPILLENMTKNLTAGLFTQFLPRKPIEGRSGLENTPLLARFQGLPYTDNTQTREQIRELERSAADEQLARHREAMKLIDDNRGKDLAAIIKAAPKEEKLLRHVVDLWVAKENGITVQERQLLALPVRQRAIYVLSQLEGLDAAAKNQKILDLARKRILTEGVMQAMGDDLKPPTNGTRIQEFDLQ